MKQSSGGLGLLGTLQIIFLVLKLANLIDWPWIYVFMPLIISISIGVLIIGVLLAFFLACIIVKGITK